MADLLSHIETPGIEPGDSSPPACAPVPSIEPDDTDDWFTALDVVVESQPAIRVYRNRRDHVVIRAEARDDRDEDACIFLATESAIKAVIDALKRELREGRS